MKAPLFWELLKRIIKIEKKTEDSEWKTLKLNSAVKPVEVGTGGTKNGINYRKIGNHVYIVGSVSFEWTTNTTLATLPERI